jgi:hypothetical protein
VPVAVANGYENEAGLRLAEKLYLLRQTAFSDGKPMNKYRDIEPLMPWLIPGGLPLGGILILVGLVGLRLRRRQSDA